MTRKFLCGDTGVCEKTASSRMQVGGSASKAPNQGVESTLCCYVGRHRFARKEFFHRHQYHFHVASCSVKILEYRAALRRVTSTLVKSYRFGLVVTSLFFREIPLPSDARVITFKKCYWAKENSRRMSRAKRPVS